MSKTLIDAAEEHGINYIDLYIPDPAIRGSDRKSSAGEREKFLSRPICVRFGKTARYKRTRRIEGSGNPSKICWTSSEQTTSMWE